MSSLALHREILENKLRIQTYIIFCIEEELNMLQKEKPTLTDEEYEKELIELVKYKEEVLEEVKECEYRLIENEKNNKKIVLKHSSFKKGGQSW